MDARELLNSEDLHNGIKNKNILIDMLKEYSEDYEILKNSVLDKYQFSSKVIGYDKYFDDDKEKRIKLSITVKNKKTEKTFSFDYGMSINDSECLIFDGNYNYNKYDYNSYKNQLAKKYTKTYSIGAVNMLQRKIINEKIIPDLLYSVLCSIRSDYYIEPLFEDFCDEFGYDQDSRKAEKLHKRCFEHSIRLQQFFSFTDEELNSLPG